MGWPVAVIGFAVLATAVADLEAAQAALDASSTASDGEGFSQLVRDEHMSGCAPDGGEPFCVGTLDELDRVMTDTEFIGLDLAVVASDSDEILDEALAPWCLIDE